MDTLSHTYTGWDRTSSVTTPFGASSAVDLVQSPPGGEKDINRRVIYTLV
jgi:hypothetical protein